MTTLRRSLAAAALAMAFAGVARAEPPPAAPKPEKFTKDKPSPGWKGSKHYDCAKLKPEKGPGFQSVDECKQWVAKLAACEALATHEEQVACIEGIQGRKKTPPDKIKKGDVEPE